jgi:protein SCO1/2
MRQKRFKNGVTNMKLVKCFLILVLTYASLASASQLPKESVYQFDSTWLDQNSRATELSSLHGKARLVAFVYTYCEHTCPLIIAEIKQVLRALPEDLQKQVPVTLITLDPKRDLPKQMKSYLQARNLDENQWKMLTGDESDVRILSNLFDVQYRAMSKDDLEHSNIITLIDAEGVIQLQLRGLDEDKREIVEQISEMY